jgi:TonB family protein
MIAAWVLYALLVGALAGAGALVLERLLRAHRLPTRWVWVGAMGLSLLWPLVHLLWKWWPREAPVVPLPDPSTLAVLDPLTVQVTEESFLRNMDGAILLVWVSVTAVLFLSFIVLVGRTRRLRRGWSGEEAAGQRVLFSSDLGPAVVGYLCPEIVLPQWCKEVEEHTLRLILDHEVEHLKAGDLRLILTLGILPILLPWHVPIWWQFIRLRLATEGDCDLRVVRKHPERTRPYLELLLQVGGRLAKTPALVAMLSEPEETLERRIRIVTMPFPKKPWLRGAFLAGLGGVLLAVACWAPTPLEVVPEDPELPPIQTLPPAEDDGNGGDQEVVQGEAGSPAFTPYTVRPEITNRGEVTEALEEEYPPLLREAGVGGMVHVWFHIDKAGQVVRTMVNESSGHQALDDAALRVANLIEFTPAQNRGEEVAVWISLPINFTATDGEPLAQAPEERKETGAERIDRIKIADSRGGDREIIIPPTPVELNPGAEAAPPSADLSTVPTFTPFTVRPDIKNRTAIARALEEEYPPLLRDAGIGGTVQVWFFINDQGTVEKTMVNESSEHRALDDAALAVARQIQFTPALNRDKRVPVWISLPITFTTR